MADVDRAQLQRYIEVEKKIQGTQGQNELKKYEEMSHQIEDVSQTIKSVEIQLAQLEIRTKREKIDVDKVQSIKDMFSPKDYEKKLDKEREEYLAALNEEEVTKQNLDGLRKQLGQYQESADKLKGPATKLKDLYEERDTLLSDIFNGEYGSELENKLEAEFDDLMDRKQRVSVAHFKWMNARVLLQHAVNQLNFAVKKWTEIFPQSAIKPMEQMKNVQTQLSSGAIYQISTETRNNLVAAHQNINSCQSYLKTILFPYCVPSEMQTLEKALVHIYTDCNSSDRHAHARHCYDVTFRRAGALLQWFDNVISCTIQQDLKKVTEEARTVEQKLRAERVNLIRAKVEESGGNVSDLNDAALTGKTDQQQMKNNDMEELGVVKPEQNNGSLQVDEREMSAPTPVPLNRLAPPPSQDEIFGNISKIKDEHKKNTEEFQKAQDLNKARLEQNLMSKLEARRRHQKKN